MFFYVVLSGLKYSVDIDSNEGILIDGSIGYIGDTRQAGRTSLVLHLLVTCGPQNEGQDYTSSRVVCDTVTTPPPQKYIIVTFLYLWY